MVVFALLPQDPLPIIGNVDEQTLARVGQVVVPRVEFEGTDVREALRWLFRAGSVGGTIAPDVQGTITVSLRNVPWETALQNVTRQVEASYRVDHGFFEVVRREDPPSTYDSEARETIESRLRRRSTVEGWYATLRTQVATGRGAELRGRLSSEFETRNATRILRGEDAVRRFIDDFRAWPSLRIVKDDDVGKQIPMEAVVVAYDRPFAPPLVFRDVWRKDQDGVVRLASREETSLNPVRRFTDVPISEVLRAVSGDFYASWTIDPALDRRVTVDLTGLPFEAVLQKLVRQIGATYWIEGGVYHIVPSEKPVGPKRP